MAVKNIVACLLLTVAANAFANQDAKQAKLHELMQLQGMTELIEQQQAYCQEQAKAMGPKMLAEFRKQLPEASEAVLDEIDNAYSAFVDAAKPTWTAAEAVAKWSEYYGEHMTEEDLDQTIAFYRSPVGQKNLLATNKAVPRWSAFFMEENQQVLESAISAYVERLKAIVARERAKKSAG